MRRGGQVTKNIPCTADKIRLRLRRAQRKTKCTTKTLLTVLKELLPFFEGVDDMPISFKGIDRKFKKQCQVTCLKLNGCVGCNKYVFLPQEKNLQCPRCQFPRFKVTGDANEVSFLKLD